MCVQFSEIKKGDLIKIKVACRWGWLRGWRVVTGHIGTRVLIRANSTSEFMIRPNEILDHRCKPV